MYSESNVRPPEAGFEIEVTEEGKCNVHFYEDIKEKEAAGEDTIYGYDLYSLNDTVYHENLQANIEANKEAWINKAKEEKEPEYTEKQRMEQEITDLYLESIEQGQEITDLELLYLGGNE